MTKRKAIRLLLTLWIIYFLGGAVLYLYQGDFILRGKPLPSDYHYSFNQPFKKINIPVNPSVNLNAVLFTVPHPKGIVIYFPGNEKNINTYAKYAKNFTSNGYEALMTDYRGFGKTIGPKSQQALYDDALQFYKLSRAWFPPDSIIIYSKSFGAAIAAELASVRDCKMLIMETPYYSFTRLAQRYFPMYPVKWILKYPLPTYEYLPRVSAPVIIFHGTRDIVIPYGNAHRLIKFLKPDDQFITIRGGGHNTLNNFPLFHQKLDSLLR